MFTVSVVQIFTENGATVSASGIDGMIRVVNVGLLKLGTWVSMVLAQVLSCEDGRHMQFGAS